MEFEFVDALALSFLVRNRWTRGRGMVDWKRNVILEIEALRERLALLSDVQLSGLPTLLRAAVPAHPKQTLM